MGTREWRNRTLGGPPMIRWALHARSSPHNPSSRLIKAQEPRGPIFLTCSHEAMGGRARWALSAVVALLANAAVLRTRGAPEASEVLKGSGVWGYIFCDPSLVGSLSISLNGMPLRSATLLPALPPKGPVGAPQGPDPLGSGGMPAKGLQQAAEFHLPPLLPGSYLLEVLHPDLIFPKYRAVISSDSSTRPEVYTLNAYLAPSSTDSLAMPLKVGPVGIAQYTPVQGGFSLMDLLRQPLVILVLVSLGIMYFMPKMQLEEETHQQVQQHHHHHEDQVVNVPYAEVPEESLFVTKLMRHSRS
ncbi:hypothetical protein Emag_006971 [Eimeria magna]